MNNKTNNLIFVQEADKILFSNLKNFCTEAIFLQDSLGRILAEDIKADRDLPPFNRVTHDGIAIRFNAMNNGIFSFTIKGAQSAGGAQIEINDLHECIEIMTGASLPESVDTVVPYEDIDIENRQARIHANATIVQNQCIHFQGKDKKQNEILAEANRLITPPVITIASAVGKAKLLVKKLPKMLIISTGNELVDVSETPAPSQVRRSNNYMIEAALKQYAFKTDMQHLPDDEQLIEEKLRQYLNEYDILLLSGGVSAGKFDYVPAVLEKLQVEKLFHRIKQRPGKPFWFGKHAKGAVVFAFPGNPVASFMCLHRYFLPWIYQCYGIDTTARYAVLEEDFTFTASLQYFLQVKIHYNDKGETTAKPIEGNGSGDFVNLLQTDAFMELPLEKNEFKKGETYRIWTFI